VPLNVEVEKIQTLWSYYLNVMNVVRQKYPAEEDVENLQHLIDLFMEYRATHFAVSYSHYLHVLREHVAPRLQYVFRRWGVGLGFFSTQSTEHGNKLVKSSLRFLSGFTTGTKNKFFFYIRDRLTRLFHFLDTVRPVKEVTDKCGVCGEVGHRRTNQLCPAKQHAAEAALSDSESICDE